MMKKLFLLFFFQVGLLSSSGFIINNQQHFSNVYNSKFSGKGILKSKNDFRSRYHINRIIPKTLGNGVLHATDPSVGQGPYKGPASTPLLDQVQFPSDLKNFSVKQLQQLAYELRWDLLEKVSKTGGHLSSSLGVIELTIALHYVYDAPEDKIIFDVSHQIYPHKMLTGRRNRMHTLRQLNGISGFAKMKESEFDAFGAGHSSTSISAAQGMSVGKKIMNKRVNNCIAVIGDGAITGGMAFEALNCAGYLNSRMIVVLNDNGQVSLPTGTHSAGGVVPAGALSSYTSRLLASKPFQDVRSIAKSLNKLLPGDLQDLNARIDEYARGIISGGTLFEELGFYYIGPIDGHDMDTLVPILENLRDSPDEKPVLLHLKTEKGYGYPPAEKASDKMHGVSKFDVSTGKQYKGPKGNPSLTSIFANTLCEIAAKDRAVVGITAAMPGGTGMDIFGKRFPKRTFDVGIAEQHAVTMAAGMATEGVKPFCCIYSTFMQRGYDQVVHDVVIQKLPVRMILDRAGLVGNDGPTHHGCFDLAYLGCLPDIVIMAPADEVELVHMIQTAYDTDDLPSVVRYPRGAGYGIAKLKEMGMLGENEYDELPKEGKSLERGKGRLIKSPRKLQQAMSPAVRVAILSIGTRLMTSIEAANEIELSKEDVTVTVADARFMKPLDTELIKKLCLENDILITTEENSIGGFGSQVQQYILDEGLLDDGSLKLRSIILPDAFIEAGSQNEQYQVASITKEDMIETIDSLIVKVRESKSSKLKDSAPVISSLNLNDESSGKVIADYQSRN